MHILAFKMNEGIPTLERHDMCKSGKRQHIDAVPLHPDET